MNEFHVITAGIAIIALAATALACIVRIVRGPTILDRMVASDMLLTTLVLSIGADMVLRGHTDGIPLMVGTAATAVFATIVVAKYVRRKAGHEHEAAEESEGVGHV